MEGNAKGYWYGTNQHIDTYRSYSVFQRTKTLIAADATYLLQKTVGLGPT